MGIIIYCHCVCVVLGLGHAKVGFCVFGTHKSGHLCMCGVGVGICIACHCVCVVLGLGHAKMGYLCPTRPEIKKIGADGGHFSEVPRLRKEISTIWLHILLLTNYMSLRSKIEPAAINIERDITKCLTWHGFFSKWNWDFLNRI